MTTDPTLESVFDSLPWDNKIEHTVPCAPLVQTFRPDNAAAAQRYFARVREETQRVVRTAWLFTDSVSQVLAVSEAPIED